MAVLIAADLLLASRGRGTNDADALRVSRDSGLLGGSNAAPRFDSR
jgi:hypothetical protein